METEPIQEPNNQPMSQYFASIDDAGKIYTDQTGQFPVTSSQGNKYVLVLYDYDSNAILTEALKNCTGKEIIWAYKKLFTYLTNRGFQPQTHWLDNEASAELKAFNNEHNVTFQLIVPYMHHVNAAECTIWTWKNHFVTGLSSTDDKFPMHLWDHLI